MLCGRSTLKRYNRSLKVRALFMPSFKIDSKLEPSADQFNLFSNFAQDNIARQLRENDTCSYIG